MTPCPRCGAALRLDQALIAACLATDQAVVRRLACLNGHSVSAEPVPPLPPRPMLEPLDPLAGRMPRDWAEGYARLYGGGA